MVTIKDMKRDVPTWCPGCGDYLILVAVQKALVELNIDPKDVVITSGIGCGSKIPHYINTYGFEGIHGRSLPPAEALKMCNRKLHVIAIGGDGDGYGIGLGHFVHACRRNNNMTYIVQNNEIYGLTKGQYSPTSPRGTVTGTSPLGAIDQAINPLATSITAGAAFVGRVYCEDTEKLKELIKEAILHPGFSHLDVLQDCPSMNKTLSPKWFRDNTYYVGDDHNPADTSRAFYVVTQPGKMPMGVIYKGEKPIYEEELPMIHNKDPICEQDISNVDVDPIIKTFLL